MLKVQAADYCNYAALFSDEIHRHLNETTILNFLKTHCFSCTEMSRIILHVTEVVTASQLPVELSTF